jgi:membrane protein
LFAGLGVALGDALKVVYGKKEKRGFVRLNLISLALTIGAIVFMLLPLALAVVPLVASQTGLSGLIHELVAIG